MRRLLPPAALVFGALVATPAPAIEIAERVFQVSFTHEGADYVFNDFAVPLLPGNACYAWYLRSSEAGVPVRVVERMTLPEAIDWGTVGQSPDDITQIEASGAVAVTTFELTTDPDGWFTHGWCVADGDPTGSHTIEVSMDGERLANFPFQVIPLANYTFPATEDRPDRTARSVADSW